MTTMDVVDKEMEETVGNCNGSGTCKFALIFQLDIDSRRFRSGSKFLWVKVFVVAFV